ncbi:MAG: signal recognition particle protein [Methylacidiphilales bacterium]|nr:signal recognition particle protein [Candidatus Methylacidiphilales bacterium]
MSLDLLKEKLQSVFKTLRGYGKLSESNVADAVREVRLALLAADVNYQVAKEFCDEVKKKSLGAEVLASIRPGEQFIKIVHDELLACFSSETTELTPNRPLRLLLCGLNGAGKTTTAGKLAAWFKKSKQHVVLVAGDLARPAAIEQLQILGKQIGVTVLTFPGEKSPEAVARLAREEITRLRAEVAIFDAAGRLDVDDSLLAELEAVGKAWEPQESLLVADAATGQTAVKVARAFHSRVPLTGLVLSKFDADTRGGAALSFQRVTQVPIRFLGTGEGIDALELFQPDRLVGRLLGMGDIVGLVEKAQSEFDAASTEKMAEKLAKNSFDLQDFLDQIKMVRKLGPLQNVLGMIPGMPKMPDSVDGEKSLRRVEAMIRSMTPEERSRPSVLNARRRQRIARGSGTSVTELNELMHRFEEMKKMMQRLTRGGSPDKMLRNLMGRR